LLAIALVAVAQNMGNVLQAALAIFGLIGVPVFAMFVIGMFIPTINAKVSHHFIY
jgi:sodium-coupled monocarboxylate transporter 8/12